jgi:hypothetical protein
MGRILRMVPLIAVLALVGTPAVAWESSDDPFVPEREFDFDDEHLSGARQGPNYLNVFGTRPLEPGSLIRIRTDFLPELMKSVEAL